MESMGKNDWITETFLELTMNPVEPLTEDAFKQLEKFVIKMYDRDSEEGEQSQG
jgi:hypothetical protein